MDKEVVISVKTVLVALAMVLLGYIVYRLRPIIGLLIISLLIVFAMESLIKYIMKTTLMNRMLSRSLAVIISYIFVIALIVFFMTIWLPPFVSETQKLIKNLPEIVNSLNLWGPEHNFSFSDLLTPASQFSGSLLNTVVSVFSNLTAFLSILVISIYMSMDWMNIKKRFASIFPEKSEDMVYDTINEIEVTVGHWIKGELVLMLLVGLASFVGLILLDVQYAVALGLISGVLEVVPMVGPVIAAIIAATIAFADTPVKGIGVIALYILIQQLENNLIVPKVMQKVSGFSPLVILIALLVGSEFFGVIGAILAIPVTMIGSILIKRFFRF